MMKKTKRLKRKRGLTEPNYPLSKSSSLLWTNKKMNSMVVYLKSKKIMTNLGEQSENLKNRFPYQVKDAPRKE